MSICAFSEQRACSSSNTHGCGAGAAPAWRGACRLQAQFSSRTYNPAPICQEPAAQRNRGGPTRVMGSRGEPAGETATAVSARHCLLCHQPALTSPCPKNCFLLLMPHATSAANDDTVATCCKRPHLVETLPHGMQRCSILTTTASTAACRLMGCQRRCVRWGCAATR